MFVHPLMFCADGTAFFVNAGISDPFLTSVATNIVNVFMTLPGMWGIERFGRRSLLIWGAVVMCICEYLIAIIGVTISVHNTSGQKALIALVCIYIAAFASTWGPIAWVVVGEIFPLNVRAKAMSLSVASNWLWNFAIGYATPYLVNKAPGSAGLEVKVFFIWGTTCACCIIFAFFCIPEVCLSCTYVTRGLDTDQHLNSYRPRVSRSSRSTSSTRTRRPSPPSRTVASSSPTTFTSPRSKARATTRRRTPKRCNSHPHT